MAIKSDNTQGNPYHDEGTGQFTSSTGGGQSNKEDLVKQSDLGSLFASDDEDFSDFWNEVDSAIKEKESQPKSIDDMTNQELLDEINDCKDYLKNNLWIEVPQGYTEVFNHDLKLTCSNFRQIKSLLSTYSAKVTNMRIETFKDKSSTIAQVTSSLMKNDNDLLFFGNRSLQFQSKYFQSYDSVKQRVMDESGLGAKVKVAEEYASCAETSHEIGHIIFDSLFIDKMIKLNGPIDDDRGCKVKDAFVGVLSEKQNKYRFKKPLNDFMDKCRKDIYDIYKQDNPDSELSYNEFKDSVSWYASENSHEWLAETFCSLTCGKPTPIAKAMEKYLINQGVK